MTDFIKFIMSLLVHFSCLLMAFVSISKIVMGELTTFVVFTFLVSMALWYGSLMWLMEGFDYDRN